MLPSKTRGLRPTGSKVREAVFNILGNRIEDSLFVDLFAGSGVMGLEALSRGAGTVFFVEKQNRYAEMIKEAVAGMDFSLKANIMVCGAASFLKKAQAENALFDIIFMDPPYHTEDLEKVMAFLADHDMIKHNGMIVIEHFHKKELPQGLLNSLRQKIYRYGDTSVSVYKRED